MPSGRKSKQARRTARTQPSSKAVANGNENGAEGVAAMLKGAGVRTAGEEDNTEPITVPALVILRIPTNETGEEDIQLLTMNGLDPMAIPALLEKSLKVSRISLGIERIG